MTASSPEYAGPGASHRAGMPAAVSSGPCGVPGEVPGGGSAAGAGSRPERETVPADVRAAAEEASAFAHPYVEPDVTVSYGDLPDQVVDLYRPRTRAGGGRGAAPLVVLLHGGAWRTPYDRRHLSPLARRLAWEGFAVASVEYRRGDVGEHGVDCSAHPPAEAPQAGRWPDTLDDVASAVDALPTLAVQALGAGAVDPRRTVLAGHSAGGHLALWAAARHMLPSDSAWHRPAPPPLRGVVALAPIADLRAAIRSRVCSDAVVQFLGGPEHVEARLSHADPAVLLPTGIATTIVQGAADNVVPPQVARAFAAAAALAGEEVTEVVLPAVGHFPLIDPATVACTVVVEEIGQLAW